MYLLKCSRQRKDQHVRPPCFATHDTLHRRSKARTRVSWVLGAVCVNKGTTAQGWIHPCIQDRHFSESSDLKHRRITRQKGCVVFLEIVIYKYEFTYVHLHTCIHSYIHTTSKNNSNNNNNDDNNNNNNNDNHNNNNNDNNQRRGKETPEVSLRTLCKSHWP